MKAPARVWIIDDDKNDIELMESVITAYMPAVSIHSFNGGEAALRTIGRIGKDIAAKDILPAFIILDLKMPGRDGFEMFHLIRSNENLVRKPVVIFSSSQMDDDIRKCYNLGLNAFVAKPVNFDDFVKVLHTMVDFWLNTCEVAEDQQEE
ncbi:MAG TPA: response regulator [Bacteroidales bacterium]|nr:response regulator [Bacteroidales bacterium]